MANTCILQPIRAVGTLYGGPPVVRHFAVSANVPAAGGAAGDVVMYDQSVGKIDVADYNDTTWLAGANNDQIDDDKLTQGVVQTAGSQAATDGDSMAGILLGPVTASQTATAPVAMFGPGNVFEANLTSWVDGDTPPTALASLISHNGRHMYLCAVDPAISYTFSDGISNFTQVTTNGLWVLSDTAASGTTANLCRVIDVGLGLAGESVHSGKGVLGDLNARVRFVVVGGTYLFP